MLLDMLKAIFLVYVHWLKNRSHITQITKWVWIWWTANKFWLGEFFCRWYGEKFRWLMQRDAYWQMLLETLITNTLCYFLIGITLYLPVAFTHSILKITWIWYNFDCPDWMIKSHLTLQLCAIVQVWLHLQLSYVYKYKLCWLVSTVLIHGGDLMVLV
jgi:hypothetical protein